MTNERPENSVPPAGVSGNSATIAWGERKNLDAPIDAEVAEVGEVAASADAALDQIDKLIGRINSTSSVAVTSPFSALEPNSPDEPSSPPEALFDQPSALPASLSVTSPFAAADAPVHKSGPHDDAALQDYMDQFLERVTGKKKPEPEGSAAPSPTLPAPITPREPEKPREIKRAPESLQDMSQMRALANETARQALGAHAGQRLISGTRNSFLGALSLSLVSSLLAVTSLMEQVGWAWTGAVLVMLLALVLTGRFLLLRGQLQKLNGCDTAPSAA
jgi:hypothetical protein